MARKALGRFADMMLQQLMKQRHATFEDDLLRNRAKEMADYNAGLSVLESLRTDPALARRFNAAYPGRQIGDIDTGVFVPTQEDEMSAAAGTIDKITTLEGLPSQEGLRGQYPRLPIDQLMAQVAARNDIIKGGAKPESITEVASDGSETSRYINPYNEAGPFQTKLPTEQVKTNEARGDVAQMGVPGYTDSITQRQQAQSQGSANVEWGDEIFQKKLELARAQAEIVAANRPMTDAQSRAQGFLPTMIMANAGATAAENRGISLGLGTQTFGNTPVLTGLVGKDQQAYLNDAQGFLNFATLILTGVQARPDEYEKYMSTYFSLKGEDPTIAATKQRKRQLFINSVARRAARGEAFTSVDAMMQTIEQEIAALGGDSTATDPLIQQFREELRQQQQGQ